MKINIIFLNVAEAERRAHFLERVEVGKWTEECEGEWEWEWVGRKGAWRGGLWGLLAYIKQREGN